MALNPLELEGIGMTSRRTRQRLMAQLRDAGINDEEVLSAMERLPRHLFIDEALASRAYENTALPIGYQQTISQPYIVARMSALVNQAAPPPLKVLEIGSGSGYQTAVLAALGHRVYSIERIAALAYRARQTLTRIKLLKNVHIRHGNGCQGWPLAAPFDAILITAASTEIPPPLLAQLAPGGRLVAPLTNNAEKQWLTCLDKKSNGQILRKELLAVRFVPLINGIMSRS